MKFSLDSTVVGESIVQERDESTGYEIVNVVHVVNSSRSFLFDKLFKVIQMNVSKELNEMEILLVFHFEYNFCVMHFFS